MEDQSKRTVKELLTALLLSNRRHARYVRVLAVLAMAVAVVVPLAIRQYGVTMTAEQTVLDCQYAGNGAHTHNADCYDADGNLVCPLPERPFHTHTASCYATERVLACGQEESAGHTHTDACYDEEGNLTCTTPEAPGHTHTDACYETRTTDRLTCGMEETADEHVHGPACFRTVTVEEPDPEPAMTDGGDSASNTSDPKANSDGKKTTEEPNPAQEFTGVLKDSEDRVVLVVAAKAPKGALPKGSTMRVEHVNLNKKDEAGLTAQEKLDNVLRREAGESAAFVQEDAVDITFYDAKGNRVDPAKKVEVRITTAMIRTFSDQRTAGDESIVNNSLMVFHVVDRQHTRRSDAPDAEVLRNVGLVNQDEDDHGTGHEDTVRFEATEFSPYVVARVDNAALAEEPDGDPADDGEGQGLEPAADSGTVVVTTENAALEMPAQSFSHRISGADGTPLLQVNVYAPEGAFPLGTTMRVSWVDPSQVEGAVAQAVAERTDGRLVDLRAVDITFLDADGAEIEPAGKITVTFASDLIDTEDDSYVVHVGDDGSAEVVDALGPAELEQREIADEADELVIESDAFSTYVVAVTTLHKELAASDGATYDITVDAPAEAGIPQDAELVVAEVAPGTAGYEDYLFQAMLALGGDPGQARPELARFFDIKIVSGGEEVQPQAPVRVSVKLAGASEGATASAVHFARSSEEAPEVLDVTQDGASASFDATGFSVYGIVYTVDFEYSIDGRIYQFSLAGGETIAISDLAEALGLVGDTNSGSSAAFDSVADFLAQVANVEFSDESLVKVTQVEGDWELESLQPFDTEESLTITMKNGDVFTVKVTDAQEIEDAEKDDIDPNKSYLICYEIDGTYYLLKNDGTVDSAYHPNFEGDTDSEHDFEHLNSTYCWSFNHIFKEQDVEHHLDKNYYLIRPIDNLSKTLTLNNEGESLVQQGNNNAAVILTDEGFILEGYHNVGTEEEHRYIHLGFENGAFAGVDDDGVVVHIYEMDSLPTYDYTVRSADESRGTVSVVDGTQQEVIEGGTVVAHYIAATSDHEKNNAGTITATPVTHMNQGQNKWQFDHWEQDGLPLDRNQYPATINAGSLPIPFNGSNLVAFFRQNPNYVVPDNEKEPSSIEDMTGWLEELQGRNIPLDRSATSKTAEVYDYQNRIYRVDFTSKANFETFAGNLDMAFCLDVSNSMYFPSALVETTSANRPNPMPIYQINWSYSGNDWWNNYNNRTWLNTSRGWNNPYYLVADASGTATVFKIYYQDGNWKAQDASRTLESDKSFIIGQDFRTNWTSNQYDNSNNKNHPFGNGDNDNTTYTIYDAGDNGNNRFVYLNQSLSGSSSDLNTIANLLKVAGESSPGVRIAYNTFNKDLGNQRQDFVQAHSGMTVNLNYASGGGTRPDQAFNDAQNFSWATDTYDPETGETTRYVILVTDGAPQGVRDGESSNINIDNAVRTAAQNLKDSCHVKFITVGLSMDNVTSGKRLLYDLADLDSNGNKMFYMAESGSDLHNIFRQITKVLMEDAVVLGDITDTVGEGFYLVNKATGLPLEAGDMIDIEGNKVTDPAQAAGVVQSDGRTIKWTDQAIDSVAGWHGTVYVKAQEELLGGNAMNTNNGNATVVATKYHVGGKDVEFVSSGAPSTLNLTADLPSPKVNVNELTFFNNKTEWTVYLGETVDPKQQLRLLYDSLVVEEVVNTDGALHYSISPNSIEERWDAAAGTVKTFSLPDLIEDLIRKDATLTAKYFDTNDELNWDVFLTDMMSTNGITLPYHEYGLTDNSNIKITLVKTIVTGEEDDLIGKSPHATTVTGDGVENYVLRIAYEPDYTVTPIGQGGNSTEDFHTGTFGTMYQGHAAGRETSNNNHVINVYAEPLDILKVDNYGNIVPGAQFELYRQAKNGESGVSLLSYSDLLTGSYYRISVASSDENGIVHLAPDGQAHEIPVAHGQNSQNLLVPGETYYLIETAAPTGYKRDETVYTITVVPGPDFFTKLDGTEVEAADMAGNPTRPTIAYNWNEGVTFKVGKVGDSSDPVAMDIAYHTTHAAAGVERTYMLRSDSDNAYVFQMTVVNKMTPIDLNILKLDADDMADENNTNPKRLGGAVFELHELDPDDVSARYKTEEPTATVTTSSEEGSKGTATFNLPAGYYEIHEVTAPDGYNLTENVTFYVKVGVGTITLIQKQEGVAPKDWEEMTGEAISELTFEFAFDDDTATVGNTPGAVLPEAGGPGTYLYTLCGVAMFAAAGFVGLTSRRKARKEAA